MWVRVNAQLAVPRSNRKRDRPVNKALADLTSGNINKSLRGLLNDSEGTRFVKWLMRRVRRYLKQYHYYEERVEDLIRAYERRIGHEVEKTRIFNIVKALATLGVIRLINVEDPSVEPTLSCALIIAEDLGEEE